MNIIKYQEKSSTFCLKAKGFFTNNICVSSVLFMLSFTTIHRTLEFISKILMTPSMRWSKNRLKPQDIGFIFRFNTIDCGIKIWKKNRKVLDFSKEGDTLSHVQQGTEDGENPSLTRSCNRKNDEPASTVWNDGKGRIPEVRKPEDDVLIPYSN